MEARTASEEVTLSLIEALCIPCLLYGLEACSLGTMEINSLNFAVKRILFKIFRINCNDIVQSCQLYINFPDMGELLTARMKKFQIKFSICLIIAYVVSLIRLHQRIYRN